MKCRRSSAHGCTAAALARLRGRRSRQRARTRWPPGPRARHDLKSCSTWACQTSTARKSAGACVPNRKCRSSSCRRAHPRPTRSPRSILAPTTTSRSRSARKSFWRGFALALRRVFSRAEAGTWQGGLRANLLSIMIAGACFAAAMRFGSRRKSSSICSSLLAHHCDRRDHASRRFSPRSGAPTPSISPEHLWVLISQLRKKIEIDPANPTLLVSEPWVGYRLVSA